MNMEEEEKELYRKCMEKMGRLSNILEFILGLLIFTVGMQIGALVVKYLN